jgi:2,3,4,5-tetrahydropyridine-2-carboxylate N-succinyltransferase
MADLQAQIEELWDGVDQLDPDDADAAAIVLQALTLLDRGEARIAEVDASGEVVVHLWLKQAILLYFRLAQMETIELAPFEYAE